MKLRWFQLGAATTVLVGLIAYFQAGNREIRRLSAQIEDLERDRERLVQFAKRLSASRRVAQVDVLEQFRNGFGTNTSVIRWNEIQPDGALGEPQFVEVLGELTYFEAAVLKFDHELVGTGDKEKGTSLALFRRIFGDQQTAAGVAPLDAASSLRPAAERKESRSSDQRLWDLFWDMMEDPGLAARYGVRVAQCEAPAVILKAGQVWEVTLDAAGGLNLRLIGYRRPTHNSSSNTTASRT